jgi:uncharacterized repeat protein (TIGR03803 family)
VVPFDPTGDNRKAQLLKTCVNNPFILSLVIAGLGLISVGRVTAQTFKILHTFTATSGFSGTRGSNSDGAGPLGTLILSGSMLYGTVHAGGSAGYGTVFKVKTDGSGFTTLHTFSGDDGANPQAGLTIGGATLYGTTFTAGLGQGTVFAVNTNGTGFTTLHVFAGYPNEGANPSAGLILSSDILYGTTANDGSYGSSGNGTLFKVKTNGSGFTTLHNFAKDSDGGSPMAGLFISGNTLYGTAFMGGNFGSGTVFKIKADGSGFTVLHPFTGNDGANPLAGLVLSGNTLYGEAARGGNWLNGMVFGVNTNGMGFTTLHSFTASDTDSLGANTNSDGVGPGAGLILSGNKLYGTAYGGGTSGSGTVFAVNTNGTGFKTLYRFTTADYGAYPLWRTNTDGAAPNAGLIISSNTLYGTTSQGGSGGSGTVFSLALPVSPQLTIAPSRVNIVFAWPTNYSDFILQSTMKLGSSAVWSTISPSPIIVNGQNVVTNPITGSQQFFRLIQ